MIIDSHCHLNYEPMCLSLKETIDRANKDGVKYLLTISTEDKSFDNILNIISNNNCVYGTYGIHPHEAKNHQSIKSEIIVKKKDPERMKTILFTIAQQIKNISILLNPIIPNATNKVFSLTNLSTKNISIDKIHDDNFLNYEKELNNLEILFNKIENDN